MKRKSKASERFHLPAELSAFKRKMAVILPKDAGAILTYANVGKDSVVVEVGAGNGFLTYYLARIAKRVYAYEIREDAFAILEKNIKKAGLNNVEIKLADGLMFEEENVDAVVADIPNAHELVERAYMRLKKGGYFVAYLPNVEQIKQAYEKAKLNFGNAFVISLPLLEYRVSERATRPENMQLFHTAFLLFAKKEDKHEA